MRIRTVILRTQTVDYFLQRDHPFQIIHNYRYKYTPISSLSHDQSYVRKHKKISKDNQQKVKIQKYKQQKSWNDIHDDNEIKIIKDESTRSLFTMQSIKWFNKDIDQKISLFENKFEGFIYDIDKQQSQEIRN